MGKNTKCEHEFVHFFYDYLELIIDVIYNIISAYLPLTELTSFPCSLRRIHLVPLDCHDYSYHINIIKLNSFGLKHFISILCIT